jgi:hypothetical protein
MANDASSRRGGRSRAKGNTADQASKVRRGTDWSKLRRLSHAEMRQGIEADPDVYPTDEKFWKNAKVVLPRRDGS